MQCYVQPLPGHSVSCQWLEALPVWPSRHVRSFHRERIQVILHDNDKVPKMDALRRQGEELFLENTQKEIFLKGKDYSLRKNP